MLSFDEFVWCLYQLDHLVVFKGNLSLRLHPGHIATKTEFKAAHISSIAIDDSPQEMLLISGPVPIEIGRDKLCFCHENNGDERPWYVTGRVNANALNPDYFVMEPWRQNNTIGTNEKRSYRFSLMNFNYIPWLLEKGEKA